MGSTPESNAKQSGPQELSSEQKFQATLARFHTHVEALSNLTQVDLHVLGGFMTLQLALAAWLAEHPPKTSMAKWGLVSLSTILTVLALKLLYNGYRRRKEVVAGLMNTKIVLRFNEKSAYLHDKPLDAETTFRPWWPWYVIACCSSYIVVVMMIFFGGFN